MTDNKPLTLAISSRALFDLSDSHMVFEQEGLDAYHQYQIKRERDALPMGMAFPIVKKLLSLTHPVEKYKLVEVILVSRNSADTGLRIFNSIQHYELPITRAVFTNGSSPYPYLSAFGAHLFLSANQDDVRRALQANCAAAQLLSSKPENKDKPQLRIAFDGDAVLFSDVAERVFQANGIDAFKAHEASHATTPLPPGPFKGFLSKLHEVQKVFGSEDCPIRTALVTARDAPSHERVVRTLRDWHIRIDEAMFLGGLNKQAFLKAFGADLFFDDQPSHCVDASITTTAGHVPHGIKNEN